jgi:hypothetical protein
MREPRLHQRRQHEGQVSTVAGLTLPWTRGRAENGRERIDLSLANSSTSPKPAMPAVDSSPPCEKKRRDSDPFSFPFLSPPQALSAGIIVPASAERPIPWPRPARAGRLEAGMRPTEQGRKPMAIKDGLEAVDPCAYRKYRRAAGFGGKSSGQRGGRLAGRRGVADRFPSGW